MRILFIEGDNATASAMESMLSYQQMNCYTTDLGEEGVDLAKLYDYDMIIMSDNTEMTPKSMILQIRTAKVKTPIMVMSITKNMEELVTCFGCGCDDYVTKPFHKDEVVARINAIVRRTRGHSHSIVKTGNIVLNLDTKEVTCFGFPVHLTGKEYQMLELLSLRKGVTITKEMFLNHLYGGMDEPELKIIDVFICKLRKKLMQATDGEHYIETIWGRGYVLRDNDGQT